MRLDQALVAAGLAPSRARARALIEAGVVRVAGVSATRPSAAVPSGAALTLDADPNPWVSRGALKLVHALDAFGLDPAGAVALDLGASTGGFSQVLLARGAAQVWAVDVGHGQLAPSLAARPAAARDRGPERPRPRRRRRPAPRLRRRRPVVHRARQGAAAGARPGPPGRHPRRARQAAVRARPRSRRQGRRRPRPRRRRRGGRRGPRLSRALGLVRARRDAEPDPRRRRQRRGAGRRPQAVARAVSAAAAGSAPPRPRRSPRRRR